MQRARSQVRFAMMLLLSVGTMTDVRGGQGYVAPVGKAGIRALSPVEIQASGFSGLSGVAVEASGAVLVTDRDDGTLTRIDASGDRRTLLANLDDPVGVAVDAAGDVLVLDDDGSRLLRISDAGSVSVVTSALKRARAIAVGPDGRVWIAMRRIDGGSDDGDSEKARASGEVIARLEPSGAVTILVGGLVEVRGVAADASHVYVAMERLEAERGRQRTTLARIPVLPDGGAGPVEPLLRHTLKRALGVAVDTAGDVFVSGVSEEKEGGAAGVILKRRRSGEVTTLAAGLQDSVAVAFAPVGDLITADARLGRVIRFEATPAPLLAAPAFTNRTPLTIGGRTVPGALVQAFAAPDRVSPLATVAAEAAGGFTLQVPLALNAETRLSLVATEAAGAGLVSAPHDLRVAHDDRIPMVALEEPSVGVHVRDRVTVRVRGADEGSGLAALTVMLDDAVISTVDNPEPDRPLVATVRVHTQDVAKGPHTVTVSALDRAGNSDGAAQILVVDRTSPETQIVTGAPRETAQRTVTFTFSGIDAQSASLEFAWRVDGSSWSAFAASFEMEFSTLAPGIHRFEVKARDRAGNEDPTPAGQTFTVTALRIQILEPAAGAVIATETVWVRGIIEGGGADVAVTIPLPPEVRNELSLESVPATMEAGMFAAEVPVTPGTTTVTAIARDGEGATSTDVVAIGVLSPVPSIRFEASPAAGLAPHATRFATMDSLDGASYALDLESDGTIDYEGDSIADQEFLYARPGVYVAWLRVATADGRMLTSRTSVQVYSRAALETRLDAAWGGFKDALSAGDVAHTASFVHSSRRAAWAAYFEQFTPEMLAAADAMFADVTLLDVSPGRAECEMMREVDGLLYSYPVTFQIDADGGWRLWQF